MATAFPVGERGSVSGVGVGLRDPHFERLMSEDHGVAWVELLADNFLAAGGLTPRQLERIAARFPVTLHCVGMNLGGIDALDRDYLAGIRQIADRVEGAWVSDHLCFTGHAGRQYHDLLPMPFSDEAVMHAAARIRQAQDLLGRRLLVENVSAYLRAQAPLSEGEFLRAVSEEADCELLLDVNNLYVNQVNLGLDAREALATVPLERVREVHLAGYEDRGHYLVDAHNHPVSEPVWALYAELVARRRDIAVCVEWDKDIPPLEVLLHDVCEARRIRDRSREHAA